MTVCCDASRKTLVFSGSTLGTYVHGFLSVPRRIPDVNIRTTFWSQCPVLDGRYPSVVWEHSVTLYHETSCVSAFISDFLNFADHMQGTVRPLTINVTSVVTPFRDFGNVYLLRYDLVKPEELMFYRAGFVRLNFLGTTKPI